VHPTVQARSVSIDARSEGRTARRS
jgi:hypothetical protein